MFVEEEGGGARRGGEGKEAHDTTQYTAGGGTQAWRKAGKGDVWVQTGDGVG